MEGLNFVLNDVLNEVPIQIYLVMSVMTSQKKKMLKLRVLTKFEKRL